MHRESPHLEIAAVSATRIMLRIAHSHGRARRVLAYHLEELAHLVMEAGARVAHVGTVILFIFGASPV